MSKRVSLEEASSLDGVSQDKDSMSKRVSLEEASSLDGVSQDRDFIRECVAVEESLRKMPVGDGTNSLASEVKRDARMDRTSFSSLSGSSERQARDCSAGFGGPFGQTSTAEHPPLCSTSNISGIRSNDA